MTNEGSIHLVSSECYPVLLFGDSAKKIGTFEVYAP